MAALQNSSKNHNYESLDQEENEFLAQSKSSQYKGKDKLRQQFLYCICAIIVSAGFLTSAGIGFLAGKVYSMQKELSHPYNNGYPRPILDLEPVAITFKSNRTYLERPSPENDKLWEGLYPKDHHGLFEWPEDKPERSGFAGFHQLHCVDALRKRFYQEEDLKKALIAGEDLDNMPQHIDETHVLHCVEFLRQSVMCHADTSLQVEASYHQGILAFGTTYPCRNWWQMVDWVNERNAKE
ncbi:uncharacterized protein EAE98_002701 [Botrytis deweyae]|uniref:Tat pathway signal sequence protein n=1 Tax=Botrytis deweyae TaxID=2478750 RepID=A0ABQ7IUH5_9HELO|nr:uncharacterized protein EAE98_002701 [Botrytis deweyae]KAF7934656.1 hypothetical protein EAE98_002701 [Botrytis deweyae]